MTQNKSRWRDPAEVVATRLALELIDKAAGACERLSDPDDAEAIHDFRVSLRRLRTFLRSYGSFLPRQATRRLRNRLKRFTAETDMIRDGEVRSRLVADVQLRFITDAARRAAGSVRAAMQQSAAAPDERLRQGASKALDKLRKGIEQGQPVEVRSGLEDADFLSWTGRVAQQEMAVLQTRLGSVCTLDDIDRLHKARLAAKRLRYILEPVAEDVVGARRLVAQLTRLQDEAGDLRDLQMLERNVRHALEESATAWAGDLIKRAAGGGPLRFNAAETPRIRDCLDFAALIRHLHRRRQRQFEALQRRWLGPRSDRLPRMAEAVARRMMPRQARTKRAAGVPAQDSADAAPAT